MTTKGAAFIGFAIGFVGGAVAAYFYSKYRIADEVVEFTPSEKFGKQSETDNDILEKTIANAEKVNNSFDAIRRNADRIIRSYSSDYNEKVELKKDEIEAAKNGIVDGRTLDDFGCNPEYDTFVLKYFKDGVLVDEQNQPIEDYEEAVGEDFMKYRVEDEDEVLIRNERMRSDFEIIFIDEDFMES